ncbi:hypothetical protein [Gayadomonas joobiniege]|uniref:hypothetical protein n=1 Tax=Gayadomonas joobiniege TaxID=1234606 RepID=UPI000371B2EA|nr:hypothetical protein [Gayadomonas joobiniege]
MNRFLKLTFAALVLAGCASKAKIEYPSEQTNKTDNQVASSRLQYAKSPWQFDDKDIEVPAYFATQSLKYCTFERNNEDPRCPLKKPSIRVYFDENLVVDKDQQTSALNQINNQQLTNMFENLVAGINRFRIITQDQASLQKELEMQLSQDPAAAALKRAQQKAILPDYLLKIDTLKAADRFYAEYNGVARYRVELTASVLDPYTGEKMPSPNIGVIRVESNQVREPDELVFTEVSGRYYSGFNYSDQKNVLSVVSDMISRGFRVLLTRLLTELPASGQVLAVNGNQISIDRGQNAGILPKETMIVFRYQAGFVQPIGVAEVTPAKNSSLGRIVKWKDSKVAKQVLQQAKDTIYQPADNEKLYVVSVGAPEDYLTNRL